MKPELVLEWNERQNARIGNRSQKDPNSPEWAYQAVDYLKLKWHEIDVDYKQFYDMVKAIVRNKSWNVIPIDAPYGDRDTMFMAELDVPYAKVRERVEIAERAAGCKQQESLTNDMDAENPVLSGNDLARARANGGKKSKPGPGRGNKTLGGRPTKGLSVTKRVDRKSSEHLKRRLASIDADTGSNWIVRYQSGEFDSVNATAKAAGISLRPTITLASPDAAVKSIIRLQGEEYVRDMVTAIRDNGPAEFVAELRRLLDE